jgi:peptidoglycan/LPS O-acetylase OafA/YrhL
MAGLGVLIFAAMRIPELDGLRGIAILLVIGCHYEVFARQLYGIPKFGWIGVDVFFVLSGYLITNVLLQLKGSDSPFKVFYIRRFLRILPPYFAALALIYGACILLGDYSIFSKRTWIKNLLFLQAFGQLPETISKLASGNFAITSAEIPEIRRGLLGNVSSSLSVLWSLSIEEYFYLLWAPLVLWFSRKTVVVSGIAICLVTFFLRWVGFIGYQTYFSIYHRFDALVYGSLVAIALASFIPRRALKRSFFAALAAGIAGLSVVCFAIWPVIGLEIRNSQPFTVFGIPAISMITASALGLVLMSTGHSLWKPLRWSAVRGVGAISYMLYLTHGLVYLILLHFFPASWPMTITSLTLSLALCSLSFRFIEKPILKLKDRLTLHPFRESAS